MPVFNFEDQKFAVLVLHGDRYDRPAMTGWCNFPPECDIDIMLTCYIQMS